MNTEQKFMTIRQTAATGIDTEFHREQKPKVQSCGVIMTAVTGWIS